MKRLALWGYGRFGHRLLERIRTNWSDRYEITMLFDRDSEKILRDETPELPLHSPAEIAGYYGQGCFDAVMVTISNYLIAEHASQFLRERGIPIETIGREGDFVSAARLPGAEEVHRPEIPVGYHYSVNREIYGVRAGILWAPLFLFDGAGHVLADNWENTDTRSSPYRLAYPMPLDRKPDDPIRLPGQTCVVGKVWSGNYWHFTYDMLEQVYLLEKAGYTGRYIVPRSEFSRTLLELLGIEPERILWQEDLSPVRPLCFEELVSVTQENYDRAKKAPVLSEMADALKRTFWKDADLRAYPSRLFVRRIGSRKLLDAEPLLEKYGFAEIIPEDYSVREQMLYFSAADIVLCPHGANSTNSLYMRPGSAFIETFGKNWIKPCCIPTLFRGGVHYLPVVEWPITSVSPENWLDDYRIPAPLLEMAIQNAITITEGTSCVK